MKYSGIPIPMDCIGTSSDSTYVGYIIGNVISYNYNLWHESIHLEVGALSIDLSIEHL
jgi:hypothetical protein